MSENIEVDEGRWKRVWRLDVPNKLKHFLWRTLSSSLPTKSILFNRHISLNAICGLCNVSPENLQHLFFECREARTMWTGAEWSFLHDSNTNLQMGSILDWIQQNKKELVIDFAVRCWTIWGFRNKTLFENAPSLESVYSSFQAFVKEFRMIHTVGERSISDNQIIMHSSWVWPRQDWVKVNFNAAICSESAIGLGIVARNHEGQVLFADCRRLERDWGPDMAEAAACLFAVAIAVMEWPNVEFDGDALNVITSITKKQRRLDHYGLLIEDIIHLQDHFVSCCFSHVKRGGNTLAHYLARAS